MTDPTDSMADSAHDPAHDPAAARVSELRPFGLRFVDYSPGRPRFTRPHVSLCPDRQVGVIAGKLASEILPVAATMTSVESDGQDVLKVDWVKDD